MWWGRVDIGAERGAQESRNYLGFTYHSSQVSDSMQGVSSRRESRLVKMSMECRMTIVVIAVAGRRDWRLLPNRLEAGLKATTEVSKGSSSVAGQIKCVTLCSELLVVAMVGVQDALNE
jgi:hypothetical protein